MVNDGDNDKKVSSTIIFHDYFSYDILETEVSSVTGDQEFNFTNFEECNTGITMLDESALVICESYEDHFMKKKGYEIDQSKIEFVN